MLGSYRVNLILVKLDHFTTATNLFGLTFLILLSLDLGLGQDASGATALRRRSSICNGGVGAKRYFRELKLAADILALVVA